MTAVLSLVNMSLLQNLQNEADVWECWEIIGNAFKLTVTEGKWAKNTTHKQGYTKMHTTKKHKHMVINRY